SRSWKGGFHRPEFYTPTQKHASTPRILRKSRMRKRARTDLSGLRSAMSVPTGTATVARIYVAGDHFSDLIPITISHNMSSPSANIPSA
ncbi:MAG: hypothetical protein WBW03_07915, partial [Silvibacterium sp.]